MKRCKGTKVPLFCTIFMIKKETIAALIENYLKDNSLFLVDINISLDNDVEVTVESYFSDVSLDNCTDITKIITDKFNRDVEDFSLTVTSAGLDQPFRILPQYLKYLGKEVSVQLKNGNKITGILNEATDNYIDISYSQTIAIDGKKKREKKEIKEKILFSDIKSTKPFINFR